MDDVTILGLAALCWAAAGYKAFSARRRPSSRSSEALWSSLGSLGAALTLFSPPVYRGVYRVSRVANLAELAGHTLVLVSASQARTLLLYLEGADEQSARAVRRRRGMLVLSVAGMTIAFRLAPVDRDAPGAFTRNYASAPWVAEYWAMFLINLSVTLVQMARQCWRLASLTERPFLGRGLQLISTGGLLGVTYFLHWGGYLLVRRRGHELPGAVRAGARLTAVAAVGAIVSGSLLPAVGPAIVESPVVQNLRLHVALRRLYPLWRSICSAVPDVALDAPPGRWRDLHDVRDLEHRHYRRVIEIRDGWLALRPYMSASVRQRVSQVARSRGLRGAQLTATVEAALVATAVRARMHGAAATDPIDLTPISTAHDLAAESDWLERVARAYRTRFLRQIVRDAKPQGRDREAEQ